MKTSILLLFVLAATLVVSGCASRQSSCTTCNPQTSSLTPMPQSSLFCARTGVWALSPAVEP
ncbi:MAG TPA: hypothetical protein VL527_09970 [Dongiaceae bacterium]|nr:hypothetical protein [Dongiaceae bacterium]